MTNDVPQHQQRFNHLLTKYVSDIDARGSNTTTPIKFMDRIGLDGQRFLENELNSFCETCQPEVFGGETMKPIGTLYTTLCRRLHNLEEYGMAFCLLHKRAYINRPFMPLHAWAYIPKPANSALIIECRGDHSLYIITPPKDLFVNEPPLRRHLASLIRGNSSL